MALVRAETPGKDPQLGDEHLQVPAFPKTKEIKDRKPGEIKPDIQPPAGEPLWKQD